MKNLLISLLFVLSFAFGCDNQTDFVKPEITVMTNPIEPPPDDPLECLKATWDIESEYVTYSTITCQTTPPDYHYNDATWSPTYTNSESNPFVGYGKTGRLHFRLVWDDANNYDTYRQYFRANIKVTHTGGQDVESYCKVVTNKFGQNWSQWNSNSLCNNNNWTMSNLGFPLNLGTYPIVGVNCSSADMTSQDLRISFVNTHPTRVYTFKVEIEASPYYNDGYIGGGKKVYYFKVYPYVN